MIRKVIQEAGWLSHGPFSEVNGQGYWRSEVTLQVKLLLLEVRGRIDLSGQRLLPGREIK